MSTATPTNPTITNLATWVEVDVTCHAVQVDDGRTAVLASGETVPDRREYVGRIPNAVLAALPDDASRAAALVKAAHDAMTADPRFAPTPPAAVPTAPGIAPGTAADLDAATAHLEQLAAAQIQGAALADPTLGEAFEKAVAEELARRQAAVADAERAAFDRMVQAEADRRTAAGA